jgi:DNA processing protein
MTEDTLRAWAYLSRVAEPPCPELAALVARRGPVEAADRVRLGHVDGTVYDRTDARRRIDRSAEDLDVLAGMGGRLVTVGDPQWPLLAFTAFGGVDIRARPQGHAPMALWVVGGVGLGDVAARASAVVGTRAASSYGEYVAADLAAGLALHDVAVVSGGAFGIDGAAHRAVLAVDGLTVAVLASGVDVAYPAGHATLLKRIGEQGLLVTEYPPGVRPTRHRFLTRNRLIAALAAATVVVEAGSRSGAANTAGWTRALGRVLCAVPGPVTSSVSVGCHAMLRNGAELITRAEDIVELVGRCGELAPVDGQPPTTLDGLSSTVLRVYDALPARGRCTVDQLAVASGLAPSQVLGPLATLEVGGLVVRQDGCWKLARRPAAGGSPAPTTGSYEH